MKKDIINEPSQTSDFSANIHVQGTLQPDQTFVSGEAEGTSTLDQTFVSGEETIDRNSQKATLTIEDALIKYKKCVFPIKGVSMLPMLEQDRDTVLVVPCEKPPKKYDLVLCRYREKYILHRLIGVKDGYYLLCGDNCITTEKVKKEHILGVAEGFFKNGKYISCSDESYLKYAKKRCRSKWRRSLKRRFLYVINKLFRKK